MSLPVFYGELTDEGGRLTGEEAHHAAVVRRLRAGERVVVADGRGRGVVGPVTALGRAEVRVAAERHVEEPEPRPRVTVVQALVKGDAATQAVALLTEVGVDAVVPWAAARSVVRLDDAGRQRLQQRWSAAAREAAKQARRLRVPDVAEACGTSAVAALVARAATPLVLHEGADEPVTARLVGPAEGDVVIVVGPEGGLDEAELAQLPAPVRLGPTVLRAAHAGAAAAVLALAASGRWAGPASGAH